MTDRATFEARCRGCGAELYAQRAGEWTIKSKIIRLTDAGVEAKCPSCGETVKIPFLAVVEPPKPRRRRVTSRVAIVVVEDGEG